MQIHSKKTQSIILFFIFLITVLNYLDRSAISFAILPLESQFGITNEQFGFILSAFGIGYFCMCFFGGMIVDRFGPVRSWAFFAILWSLVQFVTGFSQGFWSLFILRLILGLAEAIHFPALLKVITNRLDSNYSAKFVSIGLFGVPCASIIGAPFLSYIIEAFSWRMMFFALGVFGFIWSMIWLIYFAKISKRKGIPISIPSTEPTPWKRMLKSRILWGNGINFFIFGYIVFFALLWLPGYIEETFHVKILQTGFLVMLPWIVSAIFIVLGGYISDQLKKRTESIRISRVLFIGTGLLISGICFFIMAFTKQLEIVMLLLCLGLGFAFFVNSPIFSLNSDLFKGHAGTAQGIVNTFFAFSGIIAPSVTGWTVQAFGSFKVAIILTALLPMIAFLIALFLQKMPKHSHN